MNKIPPFTNKKVPFNGKYGDLGDELSYLLDRDEYDDEMDDILRIMLSQVILQLYNPN